MRECLQAEKARKNRLRKPKLYQNRSKLVILARITEHLKLKWQLHISRFHLKLPKKMSQLAGPLQPSSTHTKWKLHQKLIKDKQPLSSRRRSVIRPSRAAKWQGNELSPMLRSVKRVCHLTTIASVTSFYQISLRRITRANWYSKSRNSLRSNSRLSNKKENDLFLAS